MSEEHNYKYNFSEVERISIDCWYDVVALFRGVQWEHIDHAILEHKQFVINCLVDFMCELDNFKEVFLKNGYDSQSYLDNLRSSALKLMTDVAKKISEDEAPKFFNEVQEIFNKSARFEIK